ncbi:hypothetical protein LP419_18805 [Massilia sp. H-1]|nr:hypothetical protein LP419_18805 [Massilia sp. H-1]
MRGQAWSLRTLAEAAYITPDGDPLKATFRHQLDANLDWYNANYTDQPDANRLGALSHGGALVYDKNTALAPWMDDFFTAAVGHAAELGFAQAKPLLAWKVVFPIARMRAPGACWITGAQYSLEAARQRHRPPVDQHGAGVAGQQHACPARDGLRQRRHGRPAQAENGRDERLFQQQYRLPRQHAGGARLRCRRRMGKEGAEAWKLFSSRTVKPDFAESPQFAIIPRPSILGRAPHNLP